MALTVRSLLQVSIHPCQPAPCPWHGPTAGTAKGMPVLGMLEAGRDHQMCLGPALQLDKAGRSHLERSGPGAALETRVEREFLHKWPRAK